MSFPIIWEAWYKDGNTELFFPPDWNIDILRIKDAPRLDDGTIEKALINTFNAQPLIESAKGKNTAVIAVEDITRPARLERVLAFVTRELLSAGLKKDNIKIIICNGAHAPMLRADMNMKFGKEILNNFLILNHNPYDNLSDTNIILGKTPVRVNRYFFEADLRIGIGSIIPHGFAGFSSGGKLILPGLSDIATLERSHKYVMMGFRGGINDVETNKFRHELEDVALRIGLDFFIGIVPNSKREIAGVFSGHLVDAHRAGVSFARTIYETKVKKSYDIAIFNAYPKDSELLQADAALLPLKTTKHELVKENGLLIIMSRCSNGFGYHSLFGPGMRLSRKPIKRRNLGNRNLIVFSPEINQAEFQCLYWDGYKLANDWISVIRILEEKFHKKRPGIAILPCAPLQLLS